MIQALTPKRSDQAFSVWVRRPNVNDKGRCRRSALGDFPTLYLLVHRKSDSAISVMKTAEDRLRCDDAEALNRARERGIFAQRAMNSRLVISGVGF